MNQKGELKEITNVILEYEPAKYVWAFYSQEEDTDITYVYFTENDFLSATQQSTNCETIFSEKISVLGKTDHISHDDSLFENFYLELLSMKDTAIYWGKTNYPQMFYELTTNLFKEKEMH